MRILAIIPARYQSSRFPGKPLADINGKSMIRRVYEQCLKVKELTGVLVATDDKRIIDHVESFSGTAIMTSDEHRSGTDRCREAYELNNIVADFVINVQGDEPFIDPEQIRQLIRVLQEDSVQIATLVKKIISIDELRSPNVVKAVFDKSSQALYFSRQPIPYIRGKDIEQWNSTANYYKHLGIYAFRTGVLKEITNLPQGNLEQLESLEQLRWLENGYKIKIGETEIESRGIDSPEDLEKI